MCIEKITTGKKITKYLKIMQIGGKKLVFVRIFKRNPFQKKKTSESKIELSKK